MITAIRFQPSESVLSTVEVRGADKAVPAATFRGRLDKGHSGYYTDVATH
jgi:hypothetical protein